jgi:hypothetical protein
MFIGCPIPYLELLHLLRNETHLLALAGYGGGRRANIVKKLSVGLCVRGTRQSGGLLMRTGGPAGL